MAFLNLDQKMSGVALAHADLLTGELNGDGITQGSDVFQHQGFSFQASHFHQFLHRTWIADFDNQSPLASGQFGQWNAC